jgi:hypothetical protein
MNRIIVFFLSLTIVLSCNKPQNVPDALYTFNLDTIAKHHPDNFIRKKSIELSNFKLLMN